MKSQSNSEADVLNGKFLSMTTLETERQQQREETLKWITVFALPTLRSAWRR